jgi:hypothetical protein
MENRPDESNVDDATIVVSRTAETIEEATIVTSEPVVVDEATIVTHNPVEVDEATIMTSSKDVIDEATVTTGSHPVEEATTLTSAQVEFEEATISGNQEQTFYTEVPVTTSSEEPYVAPLAEPAINGWGETIFEPATPVVEATPVAEEPIVIEEPQKVFDTPMKNVDDELVEYVEEVEPNPVDLGNASELYDKAMKRRRRNSRGVLIAVVVSFVLIGGTIAVLWSQFS